MAWLAARGEAAGECVHRLWRNEANRPSVSCFDVSHMAAATVVTSWIVKPGRPEAHPRQPHKEPRGVGWVCAPRLRALAPPTGPPLPALCVRTASGPPPRKTAGACGPAEHRLPEPRRARVRLLVADVRL